MDSRHRFSPNRELLLVAFVVLGAVALPGCHDWPDERGTAIEAQNILREISRVDTTEDPNIAVPAVYKSPPKKIKQIVGGVEEWKLVYFCKYHTAEQMQQVIHEQFATQLFNQKGQSTTVQDYTVSANPATNQLIVRCPLESDVDAVLEIIEETDIPPIQVKIDCIVSELYADLTVDRETSILIENLFGEGIKLGGEPTNDNLAFPGAALRDPAREKFGLKLGVSRGEAGHKIEALVDILVSRGYLKILMNPTLEVINGQSAKIQSRQHVPLQQVTVQSGGFGGDPVLRTQTEYYDIIDSLEITPRVFADGYVGLQTTAQIAAYLTPEGIKQLPIVTERTITNKDNRIRTGESLVIGGIRKSEKRDVIRGVPILKDIPGLNLLFSGRDFEERATEIIFILTPTVSTGGKPNQDVVDMVRERHSSPMTQALHEAVMDPLGIKAREMNSERKIEAAHEAQMQSEAEKNAARLEAMETGQQVQDLSAELEEAKAQVQQASTKAEEAASAAEAAKVEAQKATAEAHQAKSEAEKAKARAEEANKKTAQPSQEQAAPQEQPAAPPQESPKDTK
jgi:Flp pilus assembly secretin CpaC